MKQFHFYAQESKSQNMMKNYKKYIGVMKYEKGTKQGDDHGNQEICNIKWWFDATHHYMRRHIILGRDASNMTST
jgi:hypothetical protein